MKTVHAIKLSDRVRERLQQDIAVGKYPVGEKLPPEPELMALYAVGRSTIREAVRDLAAAGVLHVQQGAGTTVLGLAAAGNLDQKLKHAEFDEINAVRNLLEREIVLRAVEHRKRKHLAAMERWLHRRRAAIEQEDRAGAMDADLAFHQAIAAAAGNRVLADLYAHFTAIIRAFFHQREAGGVGRFALSQHLHEQLYDAIRDRDRKQAVAVQQHILDTNY